MKFFDRLKFFGIGIGIGLLMVYFFFGNRSCNNWTPEKRVLNTIFNSNIEVSSKSRCVLECNNIPINKLDTLLITEGDVDFSKSFPRETPKKYFIRLKETDFMVSLFEQDSVAQIMEVNSRKECNCKN